VATSIDRLGRLRSILAEQGALGVQGLEDLDPAADARLTRLRELVRETHARDFPSRMASLEAQLLEAGLSEPAPADVARVAVAEPETAPPLVLPRDLPPPEFPPPDVIQPTRPSAERLSEVGPLGEVVASLIRGTGQALMGLGGTIELVRQLPLRRLGMMDMPPPATEEARQAFLEAATRRREPSPIAEALIRTGQRLAQGEEFQQSAAAGDVFDPTNPRWWLAHGPAVVAQFGAQLGLSALAGPLGPVAQFAAFAAPTVILEGGNAYIETREALAQQGMGPEDAGRLAAEAAALTSAGAPLPERVPGAHFVLSRVPGVRTVFQSSFVRRMRERAAGRFISGALAEGATEAAQEAWADAMQYLATRDPATFEQFRERLLAAGTLGAAVGGVADVVLGAPPVEPAAPRQPEVEAAQAEAQVAAQAQAEAAAQAAAATAAAAEAAQ